MSRALLSVIVCVTALVAPPLGRVGAANGQTGSTAPVSADSQRALLVRYCAGCHNQKLKTAGLTLDTLSLAAVGEDAATWEKIVRKLRAGLMPPAGSPRPDKASYDGLASWLEGALDRAAAEKPNPGRTEPLHRLNRVEYQNAVRDLVALDVDAASMLPADDASYGFDNIAGVLMMSPTLMDRYVAAAQKVSRLAVGARPTAPDVHTVSLVDDFPQDQHVSGLPFGTRGGTRFEHYFPVDGEYEIEVRLARAAVGGATEDVPAFRDAHQLEISVDGERVRLFTLPGEPPPMPGQPRRARRRDIDADWRVRLPVRAGQRTIVAAFLKKSAAAVDETVRQPFMRPQLAPLAGGDTRFQPYLNRVTISGPFGATAAGDTSSRRRIFTCQPASAAEEARCAKTIFSRLARLAYRRPVTDDDLHLLLSLYDEGRQEGGFEFGIQRALELLLVSPEFLHRIERDPAGVGADANYRITDLELASRLSFFLWSSIPDEELLALAAMRRLADPAVLDAQVRRMLLDRRSDALVTNFAAQWLYLRNLPAVTPDPVLFPDFDETLRDALRRETELFFGSILHEDRPVVDLLSADYTFVNERLARHYGIPHVKGSHFRRVTLTDESRRGLLGQASILTVTAYPHRTSPVLRGKWVLENLLGAPPPPPPPNVPDLKDKNPAGAVLTMRDRMAQHRSNPVCASCHTMMDPPGFSLESFDATGRHRQLDETFRPIDGSGTLPDGTHFDGVAGLRQALLTRSELFATVLTEKLLVYALGRGLEHYDAPAVRSVTRESAGDGYRLQSIIRGIVKSVPFQMRRSQS